MVRRFGSFGSGWLGILLLRFNFPEFVASPSGFKALLRLFGIIMARVNVASSILKKALTTLPMLSACDGGQRALTPRHRYYPFAGRIE